MTSAGPRREAGELESEVLAALWASQEPMTPGMVLGQLDQGLAYTTIMTTLTRLFEKGLVERRRSGRGYAYSPSVPEADLAGRRFRVLLDRGHDRDAVLQGFVNELSPEEARRLRALLDHEDAGDDRGER
jgi:predicted transcriptional regulator